MIVEIIEGQTDRQAETLSIYSWTSAMPDWGVAARNACCSERVDYFAPGSAARSVPENSSSDQLHTRHCMPLDPQQHTRQV